jgi:general stress protein 26
VTDHENEEQLYDVIKDLDICMMTTVEADGRLLTRPMANQEAEENGDIWFFTHHDGSVVKNLAANPQVSLGYSNASGRHAAISGTGAEVRDRALIEEKWTDDLEAWFPEGKDDPNLTLVKVTPDRGEFWDGGSSTIVSAIGYLRTKVTGANADDMIDHAKVSL